MSAAKFELLILLHFYCILIVVSSFFSRLPLLASQVIKEFLDIFSPKTLVKSCSHTRETSFIVTRFLEAYQTHWSERFFTPDFAVCMDRDSFLWVIGKCKMIKGRKEKMSKPGLFDTHS